MDYDFTEHYKKGDIIYQARCIPKLDIKEVNKLTIGNSIYKTYMVGYKENQEAVLIGIDQLELIYKNLKDANAKLKELSKNMKALKKVEISSQLTDEDDLESYIESGDSDE
jgi:hypothetical protein